jgi:hypothetical protein
MSQVPGFGHVTSYTFYVISLTHTVSLASLRPHDTHTRLFASHNQNPFKFQPLSTPPPQLPNHHPSQHPKPYQTLSRLGVTLGHAPPQTLNSIHHIHRRSTGTATQGAERSCGNVQCAAGGGDARTTASQVEPPAMCECD